MVTEDIMSTEFWKGGRDGALAFAESFNADEGDEGFQDSVLGKLEWSLSKT